MLLKDIKNGESYVFYFTEEYEKGKEVFPYCKISNHIGEDVLLDLRYSYTIPLNKYLLNKEITIIKDKLYV